MSEYQGDGSHVSCFEVSSPPESSVQHPPPTTTRDPPPRPPSPDDAHVVHDTRAWRLFLEPLCARLYEALYDDDGQHWHSDLPEALYGHIGDLKLDGFGARDTVDNMCSLLHFLTDHRSQDQVVERFVNSMRMHPSWPNQLGDKDPSQQVEYAWMLLSGLLAIDTIGISLESTPPPTFSGIVKRAFPPLADNTAATVQFSFSARELLEDGFVIQPTTNLLDHLTLVGNTISIYTLSAEHVQLLMGYKRNRAARAVGMADLGTEYMHSYAALVEGELHDWYRLPISLGILELGHKRTKRGQYVDLILISRVIQAYSNGPAGDRTPHRSVSDDAGIAGSVVTFGYGVSHLHSSESVP
ncbi:hypothetical protein ACG7TL_001126 [Trametes sanguinea]